jgi:hypothetical protein
VSATTRHEALVGATWHHLLDERLLRNLLLLVVNTLVVLALLRYHVRN